MDLIQSYDQGSQSSSSDDERKFLKRNALPLTSFSMEHTIPNKVSGFEPIERIPIDRLMHATAAIAAQKPQNQKQKNATIPAVWIADTEKELRMCLGSIQTLQKHTILDAMDRFISKLTKDYDKLIKPSTADVLCQYIPTYLHIYKYLFRTMEKGKRYYKRFIKLLGLYTDLELCASIRGVEYDKSIAERIVLNYQTYLDNSDNSMVLDVFLNTKRLWRQHRGILVLLFEYFLIRKTPIELPDMLFMKNLIIFKKWLYIEEIPEDRKKAREAFVRFVRPKKTLCMNSLFKPYLPLDEEGFVTITNSNDILDKEYALSPLIRCLKKAEVNLEVRQEEEEVIILTDDENDHDDEESTSFQGGSSMSCSHHDESNDCDWYSASSQQGHSSHGPKIIETVSIDSPPQPSLNTKSPSFSSLDSCDLNLDTTNSLATDQYGEDEPQSENVIESQSNIGAIPPQSENEVSDDLNGENKRNLPTLDESMFNRLVNDINSTHLSVPCSGNLSSESKVRGNGESNQSNENIENIDSRVNEISAEENEQQNGITSHTTEEVDSQHSPTNGDPQSESRESNDDFLNSEQTNEFKLTASNNHIEDKSSKQSESVNRCDNIISSGSQLQNHEETLKNIEEIVTHDLKNHETPPKQISAGNEADVDMEAYKETDSDIVQETTPQDFVPAAESTASVIAETSLLSKSEQDVLFKDRDAALMLNDLWSNGQSEETANSDKSDTEKKSLTRDSNDSPSPVTFLQNGIDPSLRMKTYARRNRARYVETKTISTQTSNCPSPITTIDESDSRKKDKHLLTEKENDELFLRDCFTTPEIPTRPNGSPRMRSPMFLPTTPIGSRVCTPTASTPIASTPIASTSSIAPSLTESLQSTMDSSALSMNASGEVVVKRKRGRPRKHPLPEPGTVPVKPPKPPRQPRQPRKPKLPSDPNESGEVEVFERMKLRERKPKPPPPPPPVLSKTKSPSGRSRSPKKALKEKPIEKLKPKVTEKQKENRRRRRNTLKMTIDAIFNAQSPNFSAIQARRISQILGISTPQLATILKRRNYDKSINSSQGMNNSTLNESGSMLQTFKNRSNGQMNNTEPITSQNNETSAPSTILARKTYIKPNITLSTLSSFSLSTLRRMSRRISFGTRRISFSSSVPRHPVRITNTRKSRSNKQSQQRYAAIDVFDTSTKSKRGRKKGSKDKVPRKRSTPKQNNQSKQIELNITPDKINPVVALGSKIDESIELVDLTKEIAPFELDATCEFENMGTALSSTQHFQNDSDVAMKKRPLFRSDDTETDVTNEFTTDPESKVEDTDDSRTRKSKRSRKRPKILDL